MSKKNRHLVRCQRSLVTGQREERKRPRTGASAGDIKVAQSELRPQFDGTHVALSRWKVCFFSHLRNLKISRLVASLRHRLGQGHADADGPRFPWIYAEFHRGKTLSQSFYSRLVRQPRKSSLLACHKWELSSAVVG